MPARPLNTQQPRTLCGAQRCKYPATANLMRSVLPAGFFAHRGTCSKMIASLALCEGDSYGCLQSSFGACRCAPCTLTVFDFLFLFLPAGFFSVVFFRSSLPLAAQLAGTYFRSCTPHSFPFMFSVYLFQSSSPFLFSVLLSTHQRRSCFIKVPK